MDPAAPHGPAEPEFGTGLRAHLGLVHEQPAPAPPQPPPRERPPSVPDVDALELRAAALRLAAEELEERERRLARQQEELKREAERLEAQQVELREQLAAPGRPVPTVLRERAEQHVERLWRSLFSALDATRPDGSADFATRVSAARALLAAAYGDVAAAAPPEGADELAALRARRAELGL